MQTPTILAISIISVLLLSGCSHRPSAQEGKQMLTGSYLLQIGSDCKDRGIEYAKLTLHSNGKYSQEGKFRNGTSYRIDEKNWEYDGGGNVFLHDLRTTSTLDISPEAGITNASLIVEFGRPTIIVLNPHWDCFFVRTE
jgi:hypothetical protein